MPQEGGGGVLRRVLRATPAIALALATAAILSAMMWKLTIDKEVSLCQMTFMQPSYSTVAVGASRFGSKYAMYRYTERGVHPGPRERFPVLFIPGSAGSPRQVRSLAAEAARAEGVAALDFYTVDAYEEFTGLYGVSLMEQAEFANDAVALLLERYPHAEHVVIIGHSMGGVIARAMFTLPNYRPGSVRSIFTLATPHAAPPYNIEWPLFKCDRTLFYTLTDPPAAFTPPSTPFGTTASLAPTTTVRSLPVLYFSAHATQLCMNYRRAFVGRFCCLHCGRHT